MKTKPTLNLVMGKHIRALRDKKDLSQEQLAKTAWISQQYLSGIETGKKNPTGDVLLNLALALGTTPSAIWIELEKELLPFYEEMKRKKKE